jgi:phosphatidylethanolamine-binding protein (PEBP) family uncharacterized protein
MAQRTGDKRLLVLSPKSASAGVLPALAALLVFALGGCGGSSGDQAASTSPSTAASTAGSAPASKEGGSAKKAAAEEASKSPEGGGASTSQSESPGSGAKHGAHIAPPKGPRERAPSAKEVAQATVANIALQSPSLPPGAGGVAPLPPAYTCDGTNSWPALSWQGVPAGTAELALFAMNVQPVQGRLFFDWAVAGLDPALTGIEASRLPKGAVVGQNSFGKRGYSICPPPGSPETYIFALYALPKRLSPERGFDPRSFRQQILALAGNAGLLPAYYGRA